ncbi:MAG: glycosyltransferase family 39 protein [Gemmatimonadetes bacterium]|nr:glycosyltransferase family 39 protein [Gemmatimonadota bacterium]
MSIINKNRNAYALLVLILAASALLRFYGISWGTDPETGRFHAFHPDERTVVESAGLVGEEVTRAVTAYAKGPAYVLWILAQGAGFVVGIEPFVKDDNRSVRFTHLMGRGISATLGILTVWVVFAIGRHLAGIWTGVLSAAFLAFCAGHVQQCHFYTVDVTLALWTTLGVYMILKLPSDRTQPYLICGLVCGMAAGTRLMAGMLCLPFLLAHVWKPEAPVETAIDHHGKRKRRSHWMAAGSLWLWSRLKGAFTPRALLCGGVVVAVAVICEPLLLKPGEFLSSKDMRNFLPSMKVAKGEAIRIWGLYDFATTPYLFFFTHLFRYALGTPLEIAALCGVALAVWRRQRGWWILLAWLVPYFIMVGGLHTKPLRYTTAMQPLMSVMGAWACMEATGWIRSRVNMAWVYVLPVALVVIPTAAYGIAASRVYRSSSRFEAAEWIKRNIPDGAGVLTERGGYPTSWMAPADRYRRKLDEAAWFLHAKGNLPFEAHVEFVQNRLADVNWIVLIEENRMRPFMKVPRRFPIAHTYYRRLAEESLGFERVAQFKVHPEILGFTYSETDAEPTTTAFDHPTVSVYRRTNEYVEGILEKWIAEIRNDPALPDRYVSEGVNAYHRRAWRQAENAFKRSLDVKPEFALGRLLLREVYLAEGRIADAQRELRKIVDSRVTAGIYVGLIHAGLTAQGAQYLARYRKLTAAKKMQETTLQRYGWLMHEKTRAKRSARRERERQSAKGARQLTN